MPAPQLPSSAPLKDVKDRRLQRRWSQDDLADAAGISRRTVAAAEKADQRVQRPTIEALARAFGCNPLELIDWAAIGIPDPFVAAAGYDPKISAARTDRKQDQKNVLQDRMVSELLLAGRPPSFHRAVLSSIVWLPTSIDDKDRPQPGSLAYNHFFQPSAVIAIGWPTWKRPAFVGYQRAEQAGSPQFVHTQGVSLLFAASYYYYVRAPVSSPMDVWMAAVERDQQSAERDFPSCLLSLLAHKIDLRHCRLKRCRPLGVITNDQRKEDGTGRIYTQYVSVVELDCDTVPSADELITSIPSYGQVLRHLPADFDAEHLFSSSKGKNWMDILAWKALQSDAPVLKDGPCSFVRGFALTEHVADRM